MQYRRFGRSELQMPVFSCGGMRYQHSWNRADSPPDNSDENVRATITRALELGIRHIETARGYGTSEAQLSRVLPALPRDAYIFQSKVGPRDDPAAFRADFMDSFKTVGLDSWDLFAIHGINNRAKLDMALRPGGCLEVARQLRAEGYFQHLGFSTHGPCDVIVEAIETGAFDYVNLHWYWVRQDNWPAIEAARRQDMGVFIISPSDKGGRLYEPSDKLRRLCAPLHPIAFNALFCLQRPEVHTLSVGAANPAQFAEIMSAVPHLDNIAATIAPIEARLEAALEETWGRDFLDHWRSGVPAWEEAPGQVGVDTIVWLMIYARALDMRAFAKGRYNILGGASDWFPGHKADNLDVGAWRQALRTAPHGERIIETLLAAHEELTGEPVKRLGGDH